MRIRVLLPLLAALLPAAAVVRAQDARPLDRIVAIVGNEIITASDLDIQILQAGMKGQVNTEDPKIRRQVLDAMVNDKLVLAQAELDSVVIPPEEISRRLEAQIQRMTRMYGSEQRIEQQFGMTLAQIRREFRDDIKKRLMVEQVQQLRFGQIEVSGREVTEFYRTYKDSLPPIPEQIRYRQIAIFPRVTDAFRLTAKEKAQRILDSIRAGADFEEMAKKYSDDPGSARNGGNLGLARRGIFVKEFEEAAFALQPGQVSDVVETKFGFHIIKLLERKGEAIVPQHILIRVEKTGESDEAAIQRLRELKKQVEAGADFAALAREFSEDEETRKFGGEVGPVETSELSEEMRKVQQDLAVGAICDPVKLTIDRDYAYAIVLLENRIAQHPATLESDYARVAAFAKVYKQNREYAAWLEDIRKNVYWKVSI